MWTTEYILSQVCVIVALFLYAATYLLKTKKWVLIVNLIGVVLNTIAFVLLGAYTGAVVNVVAMVRSIWFLYEDKKGKQSWVSLVGVLALIIGATVFTYKSAIDLLPLAGGVIYAIASWQKNITLYRWLGILVSSVYILYDIFFNSIFGVVSESVAIICAMIGLVMGYIKKKKTNAENTVEPNVTLGGA